MVCGEVLSRRLPILTQYHCGPVNAGFGWGGAISRTIYGHMDSEHAIHMANCMIPGLAKRNIMALTRDSVALLTFEVIQYVIRL